MPFAFAKNMPFVDALSRRFIVEVPGFDYFSYKAGQFSAVYSSTKGSFMVPVPETTLH